MAETPANGLTILTNGIIDRGAIDRIDTFTSDNTGVASDFVGLTYGSPNRFDAISLELGFQFGDGGDWDSTPRVFILKNPTLVGDTAPPELSPNWVEVFGATETTGHVFSPLVTPGSPTTNGTIRFDLSTIPTDDRTGWGWAVGGVDGNANASGVINFISLTEAAATGLPAPAPAVPQLATPAPVNVISNVYHSVGRGTEPLTDIRGQAFASVVNGVVDHSIGADGFDTFQGDSGAALTDFLGLQYGSMYRFDTLTAELGLQFGNGGDWETIPRIFILKRPVDTNTSRPESDPANWTEISGATETTGHVFSPLVTPGPGGTVRFDLSSIPASQRTGWGWAIGGVDGNANASGEANFISVTELTATGALVPRPYDLELEVNSATGQVRIVNDTTAAIVLDYYEITSASNSLNLAGWNSLEDPSGNSSGFPSGNGTGNGWEELGNLDNGILAEAFLQDSSTLAAGGSINLGNAFSIGGTQDVLFRYRTTGGEFVDALVQYISAPGIPGDFDHDGDVDGDDLAQWQGDFGANGFSDADADGDSDGADFLVWQRQLGSIAATAVADAVPEPSAATLAMAAACLLWRRGRPHCAARSANAFG
ncbi:MAG TPA: hypothetical protein VF175_15080 [Lacipirellula sp.]